MPNNNSSGDISQEKLNAMFKMASSKLGMSTDQLKTVLSDKKSTEELLGKIGGKGKLQSALDNPQSLEKLINENPAAKKLLGQLLEDQKHG
jgi:hypothetical protein